MTDQIRSVLNISDGFQHYAIKSKPKWNEAKQNGYYASNIFSAYSFIYFH